jgi:hypothetical protein
MVIGIVTGMAVEPGGDWASTESEAVGWRWGREVLNELCCFDEGRDSALEVHADRAGQASTRDVGGRQLAMPGKTTR